MRRTAFILAIGFVCAACPAPMNVPPPPPQTARAIRVLPQPGVRYDSTAYLLVGVVELIPCPTLPGSAASKTITDSARAETVRTGDDALELPANATSQGTQVTLERQAGAYRSVHAYASDAVRNARITIDITGCNTSGRSRLTVVRQVAPDLWEDVGGTVSGNRITTPHLPHLSIYALAGG